MRAFSDWESQRATGVFVFLPGYILVIAGCRFWLKLKQGNESFIVIGLLPLVIFFIPFVRLIFWFNPSLLAISMVMSPLILVTVVATLPDVSAGGNRSWRRRHYRRP